MSSPLSVKLIKSLHDKKDRQRSGKFLVEGSKNVSELLASDYKLDFVYVTKEFAEKYTHLLVGKKYTVVTKDELASAGTMEMNDGAIGVAFQKETYPQPFPQGKGAEPLQSKNEAFPLGKVAKPDRYIALDGIRDPGNLGTIIRICDWYGIKTILASFDTVDFYNPKVINSTMGSFARVNVVYSDIYDTLYKAQKSGSVIMAADMKGVSTHEYQFPVEGILVIGNESHGVSKHILEFVQKENRITIPKFGNAESLNAAVATAIITDRWLSTPSPL
jgi:TrmH family RNA methyltransferase